MLQISNRLFLRFDLNLIEMFNNVSQFFLTVSFLLSQLVHNRNPVSENGEFHES